MQIVEEIPSIVTWAEIKEHCRLDDDTEKSYLVSLGLACTEAFEAETGIAAASRELTVVYSVDDLQKQPTNYRKSQTGGYRLDIPKGPVIAISGVENATTELDVDGYELRQIGNQFYIQLFSTLTPPITVTAIVGAAFVPQLIKQAVLIHVETLYRNRSATSAQQQYALDMGLDRIYSLYNSAKAVIG